MSQTNYPPTGDLIVRAALVSEAVEGFEITFDGGGTFSIAPGILRFVNTSGPGTASITTLNYPGASGITPTFADSNNYLTIDRGLNLVQVEAAQEYDDLNNRVVVGLVVARPGLTLFRETNSLNVNTENLPGALFDLRAAMRPFKKEGMVMSNSGNNDLQVKSTEGEFLFLMVNGLVDPEKPNVLPYDETIWQNYVYISRDGSGGFNTTVETEIQPNVWDNNNASLDIVTDGYWSIQRLWLLDPTTLVVQPGQCEHCVVENAVLSMIGDPFCKFPPIDEAPFLGYLLVKQGTTDLSDGDTTVFINPTQVNGEYGIVIDGDVGAGNEVTGCFPPNQGALNKLLFCPEYYSGSVESTSNTTSNNWVTKLTEEVTVDGGTYVVQYGAELGQSKKNKNVGFRFQIEGITYGESIDGLSTDEEWQLRSGFVEVELIAGTYTFLIQYGQTALGSIGRIRRARYNIEKKRIL